MPALLRYTLVGAVATAVHYALLALGVEWMGWSAPSASGAGAMVGAQVAYAGNRLLTFGYRGGYAGSWLRFQGTALLGALVGMGVVAMGVRLGLHYLFAQVCGTLLVLGLTFAINRHWTFR